jgi:hypothetical protein
MNARLLLSRLTRTAITATVLGAATMAHADLLNVSWKAKTGKSTRIQASPTAAPASRRAP